MSIPTITPSERVAKAERRLAQARRKCSHAACPCALSACPFHSAQIALKNARYQLLVAQARAEYALIRKQVRASE